MATVVIQKRKRNGKKSYPVHYKDPVTFKSVHYKTFKKYKEAQSAAHELRALIDTGRLAEVKKPKHKVNLLTFKEVADLKLEVWQDRFTRKEIAKDTYEGYMWRVKVLNRVFGSRLLCEMSQKDILDYQSRILQEFSAATSNRSLFVIKQIFKYGFEINARSDDPSNNIKYLSEKDHERNKFLMPDEIIKLVGASQQTRAKFYMPSLIYLGAEHGTSKQEALSLKWKDINFNFDSQGLIKLYRTKNKKRRTEFLMPRTKKALLNWKAHLEYMRHRRKITEIKSDHVFCRLNGAPIKRFDSAWNAICKLVGFDDFHYHDLRHTFCSNLIMSGSDLKEAKDMIGHSNLSMTDRYSHLTLLHKKDCQDRLANHYERTEKIAKQ